MALQEYSEEELLAKKYNELLKISKKYGIKTAKRLKTDKLIEAILKCQQEEAALSLSQDAEAVMSALEGATHHSQDAGAAGSALEGPTHPPEEDELLLDIQFPECGPKDFLECNSDSATDISVEAVTGKQEQQGHKRSGTYEVEETEETQEETEETQEESGDNEEKKMKRSSTFDYTTSNEVTLPIDEKQTEENSKQMSSLTDKITLRGTRRNRVLRQPSLAHRTSNTQTKGGGGKAATKEGLSVSSKRRLSQSEPETKEALPSSPWQSRLSISSSAKRQRQSITMTPPAPAPALRPSLQQRRSRGTPAALTTTTTATTTATIAKPVFTIGCGDKKEGTEGAQGHRSGIQDKGTTGIPRFMSYARRLKVPNFARIHEQAFQRMDSLDDYVKKKRARQDTLSSTTKKKQEKAKVFQPSITTVKNLNFDFTESPLESEKEGETSQTVTANKGTNSHSQGPDTVTRSVKKATNTPAGARLSRRVTTNAVKPPNAIPSVKKEPTRKSPRLSRKPSPKSTNKASPKQTLKPSLKTVLEGQKVSPKNTNKTDLPTTGQKAGHKVKVSPKPKSVKKVSAVTFPVFGSHLKENYNPGKLQGLSPTASKLPVPSAIASPASVRKRMQDYSKGLAAAGPSYVPYKGAVKPLKTRDNLKNLAQRKHNVKTSKQIREGQKNILKGVRLNKRFELQMANRGITL